MLEMETLGRQPRPEGNGDALAGIGPVDQLGKDEHQGRGGHVAAAGEHVARGPERTLRQLKSFLGRVENRAAAGMDRPGVHLAGAPAIVDFRADLLVFEGMLDPARHLAGEGHLEAGIADPPLDQLV